MTMKKLKTPMYTPILRDGTLPASSAYGSDTIDAQANPTPTIDASSQFGSRITRKVASPTPPSARLMQWLTVSPNLRTMIGITSAASAAKPLYAENRTPTQLAPLLYAAPVVSVAWKCT